MSLEWLLYVDTRAIGTWSGSEGCIFYDSNELRPSTSPEIQVRGASISVRISFGLSFIGSVGLYQEYEAYNSELIAHGRINFIDHNSHVFKFSSHNYAVNYLTMKNSQTTGTVSMYSA